MTHSHEFSHLIPATRVGQDYTETTFKADDRQCALLAKRYNITSVESVSGYAKLRRESDGVTIYVSGMFKAFVTQSCVTTFEPVTDEIEEEFEGWFLDETHAKSFKKAKKKRAIIDTEDFAADEDEDFMAGEHEDPEPIIGGMVDVGELVAQFLSLALDPYPKSEKAKAQGLLEQEINPEKPNPFDVLKDYKAK
jgi:uncharacterized metal-binding protein YceD (DUF177 family)